MSSINIKFPLKRSSKGAFQTNDTTEDAIKDDLRMLLITNHGERLVHADYGANLIELVFEQGDIAQRAEDLIIAAVERWMPFVKLEKIDIFNKDTDDSLGPNDLRIKLDFSVGEVEGSLDQRIRN